MYYICEDDKPKYWLEKLNIEKIKGNRIILPNKKKYKKKEKKKKKKKKKKQKKKK